jgi:hypothetical protein
VGKYKKRPTMRVMLTRIDGGARGEGLSVPMPWKQRMSRPCISAPVGR